MSERKLTEDFFDAHSVDARGEHGLTHVVVGVLTLPDHSHDDIVFVAKRSANREHYAGAWEFPGGKIEPGETPQHALAREWNEELGISIVVCDEIFTDKFDLTIGRARITAYRVLLTAGWKVPTLSAHSEWAWASLKDLLSIEPVTPSTKPICHALSGKPAAPRYSIHAPLPPANRPADGDCAACGFAPLCDKESTVVTFGTSHKTCPNRLAYETERVRLWGRDGWLPFADGHEYRERPKT